MSSKQDVDEYYLNLGLAPGCSWEEIRASYKKLAQLNHPDRHEEGSKKQQQALAKFQLINESFRALTALFQENDELLKTDALTETIEDYPLAPISEQGLYDLKPNTAQNYRANAPAPITKPQSVPGSTRKTIGNLVMAATVIGVFWYALYKSHEPVIISEKDLERIEKIRLEAEFDATNDQENEQGLLKELFDVEPQSTPSEPSITFTFGSPMTTVLSAQGAPTLTQGNTWIYGSSKVNFNDNGKVIDWNSHPNTPLHTSLN